MTEDEQAALSLRHSSRSFWAVPLPSGRIGVFNHPLGTLLAITDTWEEAAAIEKSAEPAPKAHVAIILTDLNLDDITL